MKRQLARSLEEQEESDELEQEDEEDEDEEDEEDEQQSELLRDELKPLVERAMLLAAEAREAEAIKPETSKTAFITMADVSEDEFTT